MEADLVVARKCKNEFKAEDINIEENLYGN